MGTLDAAPSLGIGWSAEPDIGWGVYGLNLALELARRGDARAVLLRGLVQRGVPAAWRAPLRAVADATRAYEASRAPLDVVLHEVHNGMIAAPGVARGRRNVAVAFLEDTALDESARTRAATYDLVIAGSTWNHDLLRAASIEHVRLVLQGVDPSLFHPAPRRELFPDRFVIFSGGKLEFRKGQDLVVAAFREFQRRHPEALLVVAWHNVWPEGFPDIDRAGHVRGRPAPTETGWAFEPWLVENGLPRDAVLDLGIVKHGEMPQALREADVALFPNRCEGGTNLVAMECMACGVPTILSANTGHLDLVRDGACIPLAAQGPVAPTAGFRGTAGWGESSVEEIVHALERVHAGRAEAARIGAEGARLLAAVGWPRQIARLLEALAPLLEDARRADGRP